VVFVFGNIFVDDYVRFVAPALSDEFNYFGWFVPENELGKN